MTGEEAFADGSAHLGGLGRGEAFLLLDETPQVLPGKLCRMGWEEKAGGRGF